MVTKNITFLAWDWVEIKRVFHILAALCCREVRLPPDKHLAFMKAAAEQFDGPGAPPIQNLVLFGVHILMEAPVKAEPTIDPDKQN